MNLRWCGRHVLFDIQGELDLATGPLLTSLIEHAVLARGASVATLDLSGVGFFGADGVTALMRVLGALAEARCQLILVDPSPMTMAILEITRTAGRFDLRHGRNGG